MESANSEIKSVNISLINDGLLAGLYSSGHSNLDTICKELFNLVIESKNGLCNVNFTEEIYETTIFISFIQYIIDSKNDMILVVYDEEIKKKYINSFKLICKFIDNINIISNLDEVKNINNLYILKSEELSNSKFENVKLIVFEDCYSLSLLNDITDCNKIIINKNIKFFEKTIKKPIELEKSVSFKEPLEEVSSNEESISLDVQSEVDIPKEKSIDSNSSEKSKEEGEITMSKIKLETNSTDNTTKEILESNSNDNITENNLLMSVEELNDEVNEIIKEKNQENSTLESKISETKSIVPEKVELNTPTENINTNKAKNQKKTNRNILLRRINRR